MKKAYIHIHGNIFLDLQKAKGTHKYIKRLPHPNPKAGRKWIYFYTQQQVKDFKEKGVIPGEEKKEKGSILSGIMNFFGFKSEKQAADKVNAIYSENKQQLQGVDKGTFADHMNEYLSNKEKWDARLSGEKKEKGEKKEGEPKIEKPKSEEQGEKKPSGKKWDIGLMRKIAGIVGVAMKTPDKEFISKLEKEYSKLSEKELKEKLSDAKLYNYMERVEAIEKVLRSKSSDNFGTMPEGEGKGIKDIETLTDLFHSKTVKDETAINGILKIMKDKNLSFKDIESALENDRQLYDIIKKQSDKSPVMSGENIKKQFPFEGFKDAVGGNATRDMYDSFIKWGEKQNPDKNRISELFEKWQKSQPDKSAVMSQEDENTKKKTARKRGTDKEEFVQFIKDQIGINLPNEKDDSLNKKKNYLYTEIPSGRETRFFSYMHELGINPERHMHNKYWIPINKEIIDKAIRGNDAQYELKEKEKQSSQSGEGGGEIEKEGLENLSSAKKYIENIMEGYKEQAKKAEAQGISKEKIDSALSAREKDAINYVKKLQSWIDDKDYNKLKEILHSGNKMSKKMFEEYTGINLGNTQSITNSAIEKFVGEEKVNAEKVKKEKAEKEKEIKEREEKEARDKEKYGHLGDFGENLTPKQKGAASKFLKEPVRWGDEGVSTRQEKIDKLINDGWEIKSSKYSGKRFQSRDGSFYDEFDKKTAMDYIEHKLKKLGKFKETEEIKYNQEYSTLRDKKDSLEKQIDKMDQGWGTSDSVREKIREKRKEIEEIKEKLKNMDSNPPEPMQKASQLATGTKIESEHKDTVKFIADYLKKYDKLPSNKEIYESIAKDHIGEIPDYYARLNKMESEAESSLSKATDALSDTLEKGKPMPVGTVSKGKKKVAEGKWVPVKDGKETGKQEKPEEKGKKTDDKKEQKGTLSDEHKGTIKSALKKMANILAEALSGRDVNQPTGSAIEQTGENLKSLAKPKQKTNIEADKKKEGNK